MEENIFNKYMRTAVFKDIDFLERKSRMGNNIVVTKDNFRGITIDSLIELVQDMFVESISGDNVISMIKVPYEANLDRRIKHEGIFFVKGDTKQNDSVLNAMYKAWLQQHSLKPPQWERKDENRSVNFNLSGDFIYGEVMDSSHVESLRRYGSEIIPRWGNESKICFRASSSISDKVLEHNVILSEKIKDDYLVKEYMNSSAEVKS